jgi:hypothetical protein
MVWPAALLDLWERMVTGAPIVDLGTEEESTVPVEGMS